MTGAHGGAGSGATAASGASSRAGSTRASAPVVTLGETMALMTGARLGTLAHVDQAHVSIGGAESNVAVGLSRLGAPVRWIGRVGEDSLGTRVVRELRGEGIEVRGIEDADAATGLMLKELTGPGTARVLYYRRGSAGSRLCPEDLAPGVIEDAALLHLTGITPLLSDAARRACREAVRRAQAAGVPVSFDVNHRRALAPVEEASAVLCEFAAEADLLFGSLEELAMVLGEDGCAPGEDFTYETLRDAVRCANAGAAADTGAASGAGAREVRAGVHTVEGAGAGSDAGDAESSRGGAQSASAREIIVKLGEGGAAALVPDGTGGLREVRAAGHRISVVDTVGAGDSFVAGYLSGVLAGMGVEERLARANACGAYMCTAPGDWEGAPTLRDLDGFGASGADPVQR